MGNFTIEDIKKVIDEYDYIRRPCIAFLHPDDAEDIKSVYPKIEEEIVIQATPFIEKGMCVVGNRNDYEPYLNPCVKPISFD